MNATAPPPRCARSPSPTAPPLIRGPSPLGRKMMVFEEDGRIVVSEPVRPVSAPPVQPSGPRPPSPGSASLPLNPPDQNARQNSRRELQKIDCQELQKLLHSCLTDFTSLCRALLKIQSRISRHWTVPQRAVRLRMKALLVELTMNASHLVRNFMAVSHAARKILNFLATCIKNTHGLSHFSSDQPLTPVISELRLLHTHFAALERVQEKYGEELAKATEGFEQAMDPDGWAASSPLSPPTLHLSTTHLSLLSSLSHLSHFFLSLSLTAWHPPLLSPEDVKKAAGSWREVERRGRDAAGAVTREGGRAGGGGGVGELWSQAATMGFVGNGEADEALRKFALACASSPSPSTSPASASTSPPGRTFPPAQPQVGTSFARPSTSAGKTR
ncbi:hypothetical protein JCM11251_003713 [Rhodosporidiobolus azoricus]